MDCEADMGPQKTLKRQPKAILLHFCESRKGSNFIVPFM